MEDESRELKQIYDELRLENSVAGNAIEKLQQRWKRSAVFMGDALLSARHVSYFNRSCRDAMTD